MEGIITKEEKLVLLQESEREDLQQAPKNFLKRLGMSQRDNTVKGILGRENS